jgi:bifunctional UDP-N-acetylglucosamine pyrophosphorylase / glucosamine-1-phosphate N-acetyltransferase
VAPVTVGAGAVTAAGTTVYRDVPPGALALTRPEMAIVEGWAERKRQKALGLAPAPKAKKTTKKKVVKAKPKRRRG